jgi:hypothetical protein
VGKKRKKGPAPSDEQLLRHYLASGCPMRDSWLVSVYSGPSYRWTALYLGSPPAFASDPFKAVLRVVDFGCKQLEADVRVVRGGSVEIRVFEFSDRESGVQFDRDARQLLGSLGETPHDLPVEIWNRVRALKEEAVKKELAALEKHVAPHRKNMNAQRFFQFEDAHPKENDS